MDQLDRKILRTLMANARTSNAELARECGVAPSTILERIRRLEDRGVLRGYIAEVDPEALGYTVRAVVLVTLDQHEVSCIRTFEEEIRSIPFVRSCQHLSGRFDYLVRLAARDVNHLGELIKERIAAIPGIGKAESFLVFSDIKIDRGWPMTDDPADGEP